MPGYTQKFIYKLLVYPQHLDELTHSSISCEEFIEEHPLSFLLRNPRGFSYPRLFSPSIPTSVPASHQSSIKEMLLGSLPDFLLRLVTDFALAFSESAFLPAGAPVLSTRMLCKDFITTAIFLSPPLSLPCRSSSSLRK